MNVKLHKSEGTVRELQTQVYELQKTITHLNRRDGEASKDDSYFSNKFSVVADSIVQWVLANFRGASKAETKPEWSLLSLDVKKYLEPYKSSGLFKSRQTRLRVVGGIVAEILRTQIFDCFIFGAPGSGSQFEDTQRQLKGTGEFFLSLGVTSLTQLRIWFRLSDSALACSYGQSVYTERRFPD